MLYCVNFMSPKCHASAGPFRAELRRCTTRIRVLGERGKWDDGLVELEELRRCRWLKQCHVYHP